MRMQIIHRFLRRKPARAPYKSHTVDFRADLRRDSVSGRSEVAVRYIRWYSTRVLKLSQVQDAWSRRLRKGSLRLWRPLFGSPQGALAPIGGPLSGAESR